MNEQIKKLAEKAKLPSYVLEYGTELCLAPHLEKFAELIVSKVLDEVEQRAYYSGDRAWSDDLDRPWIELEFGFGALAELKK